MLQLSSGPATGGAVMATAQHRLAELRGLYRGVVGAACGAGIIIGTYFAFYSTTKSFLRRHSDLNEGEIAQQHPHLPTFILNRHHIQH